MRRVVATVALGIAVSWAASMLLVLGYGKFVPQLYTSPDLQAFQETLKYRGYLTQQELEEMARKSAQLHDEVKRRIKEEDRSLWFAELRLRALQVSWLPWALFGLFALRDARTAWFMAASVILLSLAPGMSIQEAVAFSAAVLIAFHGRYAVAKIVRRHSQTNA